jgi:hypothetical protein
MRLPLVGFEPNANTVGRQIRVERPPRRLPPAGSARVLTVLRPKGERVALRTPGQPRHRCAYGLERGS